MIARGLLPVLFLFISFFTLNLIPHPSLRSSPPLKWEGSRGSSALHPSKERRAEGRAFTLNDFSHWTPTKNFTKIVTQNGAIGIGACGEIKRRTRSWSTPHAEFAISLCGVHYSHRRKSAEKHAEFNRTTHGICTFFARRWKFRPRKTPAIGRNAF